MVNNLTHINNLLTFESEDDFYFLQILKRRKENPDQHGNSRVIRTYYINSSEYLLQKFDEIKTLCELNNARAYFNLNKRSFERIAFHTLKKITDCIMNKDFKSIRNAYDSVCGEFACGDRTWLIDIDEPAVSPIMLAFIDVHCDPVGRKVITTLPTINGHHIITKPFNTQQFKEKYPGVDIQKNNPTLLYYNGDKTDK